MIDLFEIFDSIISQSRSVDVAESEFRKQLYEDEELLSAYKEQISALIDGGVDCLLIETIFDSLNARAAIVAANEIYRSN